MEYSDLEISYARAIVRLYRNCDSPLQLALLLNKPLWSEVFFVRSTGLWAGVVGIGDKAEHRRRQGVASKYDCQSEAAANRFARHQIKKLGECANLQLPSVSDYHE